MSSNDSFKGFSLDVNRKVLFRGGEMVDLPPKAIEMLIVLLRNRGKVVTKQELLDTVWGDTFVEESVLSNNVYLLRKAIGELGPGKQLIKTVPRRGYKFEDSADDPSAEFVLEHHVFEQTLIEDVSEPSKPAASLLPAGRSWPRTYAVAGACLVVIAAIGIVAMRWSPQGRQNSLGALRSIAVMPMRPLGGTDAGDGLGLRISDAIITRLGKADSLVVRPTTATAKLENSDADPAAIGRDLEVDAVLIGGMQTEGNNIRLTLQLISVAEGRQLWSDQIDGDRSRLLYLQDSAGARVLAALVPSGGGTADASEKPKVSDAAYEEYSRGRYFWNKRSREGLNSAISAFKAAIAIDPNYADAHAALGDSYAMLWDYGYDVSPETTSLASASVDKALSIDPTLSDAYSTRGLIEGSLARDWKAADSSFRRSIELAPNSATARHRYGVMLIKMLRFDEAEEALKTAKKLDPSSSGINMNYGLAAFAARRFDEAQMRLERAVELNTSFSGPRWYLARCLWQKGQFDASVDQFIKAMQADGDDAAAEELAASRRDGDLNRLLDRWLAQWKISVGTKGIGPHDLAIVAAMRHDREETLHWLERSADENHPWTTLINAEPEFDFVRDEPRFQAIAVRVGL